MGVGNVFALAGWWPFGKKDVQEQDNVVQGEKQNICLKVSEAPWASPYDIEGDGYIDGPDAEAMIYSFAQVRRDFDKDCLSVKLSMLDAEVQWKLRTVVAYLPQGEWSAEQKKTALEQIDVIERRALGAHEILSEESPFTMVNRDVYARIVEMCLRARNIVEGSTREPFGLGVNLIPFPNRSEMRGFKVTGIHPESAALRSGLRVGDEILAVGGKTIPELSTDGTPEGSTDPDTQMLRGMAGERGSVVRLQVLRKEKADIVDLEVRRNIWSARVLTVPDQAPLWDGTVMYQEMPK